MTTATNDDATVLDHPVFEIPHFYKNSTNIYLQLGE